ncbi:MAG: hypothetical protein ABW122_06255 [Ilumatobacteraceae bacterium]
MQARNAYPLDAVTGGCFVTRRYEIVPGERIVDLDCDLDTLPAWGRLCVSEQAVRLMAGCLDIEIPEENILDANEKLRTENRKLRAELTKMRHGVREVLNVAELSGLSLYIDEGVAS